MSFRRKPESSLFTEFQNTWIPPGLDPGSTGVAISYEAIKVDEGVLPSRRWGRRNHAQVGDMEQ